MLFWAFSTIVDAFVFVAFAKRDGSVKAFSLDETSFEAAESSEATIKVVANEVGGSCATEFDME